MWSSRSQLPVEDREAVQGKGEHTTGACSTQETSEALLGTVSAQGCWGVSGDVRPFLIPWDPGVRGTCGWAQETSPWDPCRVHEDAGGTGGRGMVGSGGAGRRQRVLSLLEVEHLLSMFFSLRQWRGPEDTLWVSPPSGRTAGNMGMTLQHPAPAGGSKPPALGLTPQQLFYLSLVCHGAVFPRALE